jgi:hypothetical protein
VNVATKGGSNDFHGQAYYEFTGSGLNASDRGYWQRSPKNANQADFFKPKEDDYGLKYPGGSLGGRIIKDRLFFFGSFAPELENTTRNIDYASGAKTYKQDVSITSRFKNCRSTLPTSGPPRRSTDISRAATFAARLRPTISPSRAGSTSRRPTRLPEPTPLPPTS